jgi:hypothetical protein
MTEAVTPAAIPIWTEPVNGAATAWPTWMLLAITGLTAGATSVAVLWMRGREYGYGGYGGGYGSYGGGYGYGMDYGYGRGSYNRQRYGGMDDYYGSRNGYGPRTYTDSHIDEFGPHGFRSTAEYLASPDYGELAARTSDRGTPEQSVASHRSRSVAPYLESPYYNGTRLQQYAYGGDDYGYGGYSRGGYGGYRGNSYGGRMGGYGMGGYGMGGYGGYGGYMR